MMLALRETETWTAGSIIGGLLLLALVIAIAVVLINVTLRR